MCVVQESMLFFLSNSQYNTAVYRVQSHDMFKHYTMQHIRFTCALFAVVLLVCASASHHKRKNSIDSSTAISLQVPPVTIAMSKDPPPQDPNHPMSDDDLNGYETQVCCHAWEGMQRATHSTMQTACPRVCGKLCGLGLALSFITLCTPYLGAWTATTAGILAEPLAEEWGQNLGKECMGSSCFVVSPSLHDSHELSHTTTHRN